MSIRWKTSYSCWAPPRRVPVARERREPVVDLVELHPVAAVVAARLAEAQFAAREHLADDLGDVAHPVVLLAVADVEDLVVHHLARRLEHAARSPCAMSSACTSGRHGVPSLIIAIRFGRPRQAGQVVQHDVEPHPRRGAERGRVAQEGRREVVVGHAPTVALDERLALGVRGLRVDGRGLVDVARRRHAVDAARRHVDEALDPCRLGQRRPAAPSPGG